MAPYALIDWVVMIIRLTLVQPVHGFMAMMDITRAMGWGVALLYPNADAIFSKRLTARDSEISVLPSSSQ
jgi:hypothetical protein